MKALNSLIHIRRTFTKYLKKYYRTFETSAHLRIIRWESAYENSIKKINRTLLVGKRGEQ